MWQLRNVGTVQGQLDLGFDDIPGKLVRVTPARLGTWAACPRRYRMAYLDRPTPSRSGGWAHSTLGAVVHNVLRAFFEFPDDLRTPERAALLIHRYWSSEGFQNAAQAADYRARAEKWVTDYVRELEPGFTPLAVERWVSAPLETIIAEGRVDRIDQRDELVIVDYKTGRHGLTTGDASKSLALAMYALASERMLHQRCRRVELHHVPTGRVDAWEHTEDSLAEHLSRAQTLASELAQASENPSGADESFPPSTGRHCAWCDFRAHCPEGQQAAAEIPSWALLGE